MAEIKWFGHACVQIRARDAIVMMDPVPRSFGYRFGKQRADIVTVSHDHPGHTATEIISTENFHLIDGPGEYEISNVFIRGVRTYHDTKRGAERGRNTIYTVEIDGITVCHLGDLGHELTEDQNEAIGDIDVLLVPVGGGTVLDGSRANDVVGQIEPNVVIPIQYRTEYGDHEREDVTRFLAEMGAADVEPVDKYSVTKSSLVDGSESEVVVLMCSATGR